MSVISEKEPSSINNIFPYNAAWAPSWRGGDADPSFEKWRVNSDGEYEYFGNTDWHRSFTATTPPATSTT